MDVTFNLDDPQVEEMLDINQLFWGKYDTCLVSVRADCSARDDFFGFKITSSSNPDPPCRNIIFELTDQKVGLIVVTVKYERGTVYLFAFRRGRGEPDTNNNQNNYPWRQCGGYNYINGALDAGFGVSYGNNDLGIVRRLGVESLRNAVTGLWFGENTERCLRTLAVHISEPVRSNYIAEQFKGVIQYNMYGAVYLTDFMIELIKNWQGISKAIQKHLILGSAFEIPKPSLRHLTIEEVTSIMSLIKHFEVDVKNI